MAFHRTCHNTMSKATGTLGTNSNNRKFMIGMFLHICSKISSLNSWISMLECWSWEAEKVQWSTRLIVGVTKIWSALILVGPSSTRKKVKKDIWSEAFIGSEWMWLSSGLTGESTVYSRKLPWIVCRQTNSKRQLTLFNAVWRKEECFST